MPRVRKNQGMEFDAEDFVDSMLDGYGGGVDQEEFVEGAAKMGETRFKSKNLEAERRRRNKLNSKLFTLRSLVPNITKMSKESTITDAMDYIGKLEKRIRDLQLELAKIPDLVGENQRSSSTIESMTPSEIVHCPGKVEMNPVGKNKFHVNITCMKRRGGLTKLLEAIAMQGMEVTEFSSFAFSGFSQIVMCVEARDGFNAETDEFRKLLSVMVGASKEK